ncbi:MAG: HAD family phosphatase [Alphaproteobacteria bacterium]|nr:HAD family phosphatase [Alphaproteobacteria bacterium]
MNAINRFDTVVFDLGGVLIDWSPYHLYRKLFDNDEDIARFLEEIDLYTWLRGVDADKSFQRGVEELSARLPHHADLIEAYWHRWAETLNGTLDDSVAIVSELKEQGRPLYVISNWSSETWHHATDRFGFLDWFDDMVISGLEGIAKPSPGIFHLACERFKIAPEQTVFIDDLVVNVESAREIGFHGIHFTDAGALRRELVSLGLLS